MMNLPPRFDVARASVSGAPGVAVRGEVDIYTAPDLAAALDEAIRESVGALIVDLTGVAFLDSTGVQELMRARAVLGREDRTLVVICPPGPARRTLDVTGVAELLPIVGSAGEAVASLRPA